MSNADVFRTYLERFAGGDVAGAADLLTDEFTFHGPILQADSKAEFLAGSATAAQIARGCHIHHQWVDGEAVCSIYDFKIETPAGAGSVPMAEWSVIRDGKLVSSQLIFDAAAMAGLMPGELEARPAVPKAAWTGYGRFCPLARALDVVGERWTLVIFQEVLKRPSRYSDLARRLPGIGTTVLAARLRKLEAAGVVERRPGSVGEGIVYAATERGAALGDALGALRRWGVTYLTDPTADGGESHEFDLHYVDGIDTLDDACYGLVVDGNATTLRFTGGHLEQSPGAPDDPELVVHTTSAFMDRWAVGDTTWDDGLADGDVTLTGPTDAWPRWQAATGYLLAYQTPAREDRP